MRDEVVVERRRQVERRQPLVFDQRQRVLRVPARLADEAARDDRHREQRVHPHRVVERHHPERPVAEAEPVLERLRDAAGAVGRVRARHALRAAGCAGGVEHQARRAVVEVARRRNLLAADELVEARLADGDGAVRVARDELCARVVDAVGELVGVGAPRERDEDRTEPLRRPIELDRLVAVVEHGRERVAAAEAELGEASGEPRGAFAQVGIGEPDGARLHERVALGRAGGGAFEDGREVHGSAALSTARTIGS
jgi:hypothetical protein